MEKIAHAAIKRSDGVIVLAKQHADCIRKSPLGTCKLGSEQGFITNKGRFVDRKEGSKIAFESGQIENQPSTLLSEHLWNKVYGARHNYDEEKGYYSKES